MHARKVQRVDLRRPRPAGDLLATKISAPVLHSMLVRRERLTELLWMGMQRRVTLIHAPAGYGKTTLVREWAATLAGAGWPVAWIRLDAYDNDPLRFWSYVVGAIKTIHPSLQANVETLLTSGCEPRDCTQLDPLLNEIADIQHSFSLVFDDLHEIQDDLILHSLSYFIDHLPDNVHLVLASRVLPPVAVARYRARGDLIEVTARELSFNLQETRSFLFEVMNLDLSPEELVFLLQMTEGWIAGLQLAALWLQSRPSARNFVADFTGSHRHILDYLVEEVLNHQSEAVKDFLIKTSILTELSAPLCDAILERTGSREILENLEQANLFILPLDERRRWHRYHALFADVLRTRLEQADPAAIPRLRLAACRWLNQNGYPEKAVIYALAAGEPELAADIVEACALTAIIQMDLATVLQWFRRLPEETVQRRPRLMVYCALAYLMAGKTDDLIDQLDAMEENLRQAKSDWTSEMEAAQLKRYADAVRAAANCIMVRSSESIIDSHQVIELLPLEDHFFLGLVEHYLAYAYQAVGKLAEGTAALDRACRNALLHEFHNEYVISQSEKARFYRLQGKLKAAAEAYELALDYARTHEVTLEARIIPRAGLAEVYREWNRIAEADRLIAEPMEYYLHNPMADLEWYYAIDASLAVSRNRLLHGEVEKAAKCVQRARRLAQNYRHLPGLAAEVNAVQMQVWLAQDKAEAAQDWVENEAMVERQRPEAGGRLDRITLAAGRLSQREAEAAESILVELAAELEGSEHGERRVQRLVLLAMAQAQRGGKAQAMEALEAALRLAEPEDRVRTFIDHGELMRSLLSYRLALARQNPQADRSPPTTGYLLRLCEQYRRPAAVDPGERPAARLLAPLQDPLSEREMEVLVLLSKGFSAGEAAKELMISLNTAKAHLKSIYQKLDVHSRRTAIEKAIELHLLKPMR